MTLEDLARPEAAEAARAANVAAGAAVMALDCIDAAEPRGLRAADLGGARAAAVRGRLAGGRVRAGPLLAGRGADPGAAAGAAGIGPAGRMAVVSGSVSPVTAAQIDWSLAHGFEGIAFDARAVVDPRALAEAEAAAVAAALDAVGTGRDPLIFTARGPDDPAVPALHAALAAAGLAAEEANVRIGTALGRVLDAVIREAGLARAVISGGDTSGHASRQLGIHALTALAPTIPGAAIFRAHGDGRARRAGARAEGRADGEPGLFRLGSRRRRAEGWTLIGRRRDPHRRRAPE